MPEEDTVARLQRIFEETLGIAAPRPDTDIIEGGLLDSLALVTLLFEIEREFGTEIPLETVEMDDLRSIQSISLLLTDAASAT
jgi:acyl carrier protein